MLIMIEGFDLNCSQHITPRFTEAEIATGLAKNCSPAAVLGD